MSLRPLLPALAEKARLELNEDPARITKDIQQLKVWISEQPHLKARTDDQWLVAFLRGCKYNLDKTKYKLDLYYALRTTSPDLYRVQHTESKFEEIMHMGAFILLPKPAEPDSPRVGLVRPGIYDPKKYSIFDILSVSSTVQKIMYMEDDHAVVAGAITILDLENVTLGHFLQMTPMTIKKLMLFMQDATPLRMKGSHYLNTPPGFETIFNIMKNFLNEKNRNRLFVHNKNYEELYKHVPKDVLPEEYGGNGGCIQDIIDHWKKKVHEYKDFLDEDLQYGTDESKRPGKGKTAEEVLDIKASFRQLSVD